MNGQCRNPGCERLATLIVRIPMVGDRAMCHICWQALAALGMDIRRIDEPTSIPAWRQRSLARDFTGTVA